MWDQAIRATRELAQTAEWITAHWNASPNRSVLEQHLR